MSMPVAWNIHIDGAARGNPGPAAYAFIIQKEGSPPLEEKGTLGTMTNNLAEYTALVRALERACALGAQRLIVHSDSELLVKQMNGEYRVKNPELRMLYDRARELSGQFKQLVIRHIPREHNSRADQLCNEALDEAAQEQRAPFFRNPQPSSPNNRSSAIREKAIRHLRAAAVHWAKGDSERPEPEAVWDQIWRMLEDARLVLPLDEEE